MWTWLAALLGIGGGVGLYQILKPATKSEVVQFTQNAHVSDLSEAALQHAGIDYDVNTDGSNMWIQVAPANRQAAVSAIRTAAGV